MSVKTPSVMRVRAAGAMALAVMPYRASSAAWISVSVAMPALADEYDDWPTDPRMPAPDDVLMMRASTASPAFDRSRHQAAACRDTQKWPFRCTRTTASHSSSEHDTNIRSRTKPALFTTTSSPPNTSIVVSTSRWAPAQSAMSSPLTTACPPAASISVDDLLRRRRRGPGAVELGADVVHHDPGALGGEGQGVGSADAATGAGDDDDAAVTDACRCCCHGAMMQRT